MKSNSKSPKETNSLKQKKFSDNIAVHSQLSPSFSKEITKQQNRKFKFRKAKNKAFTILCFSLTILAMFPLALIIFHVTLEGFMRLDFNLITNSQPGPSSNSGGILNAITGTLILVGLATAIASPPAILAGVYLAFNKKSKISEIILMANTMMQSMPAIIFGIIAYSWIVQTMGGFSMFSGTIALALMMLPYITLSTAEVIKMIPNTLLEAGYALGASYPRVIIKIVLPLVAPGIVTSMLLAISRVAGEAAPLLFTAFGNPFVSFFLNEPVASMPLLIYQFATSPYDNWRELAWATSLLLIAFIISANMLSKWLTKRSATF